MERVMSDARDDSQKIVKALERSVEIYRQLMEIQEEKRKTSLEIVHNLEAMKARMEKQRSSQLFALDFWMIALVILVIVVATWMVGIGWKIR